MKQTLTHSLLLSTLLLTTTHATEKLEEIQITTATKSSQPLQETTSSVTVITAEQIEARGYLTVAQVLSHMAGFSIVNSGGIGQNSSLFVRGSGAGKVLVLVDGLRINDPSTPSGKAFLENLTTSNIAHIEVLKGATGSLWGSNASAGVIHIITKQPNQKGLHGSLSLAHGSYNTTQTSLNLNYVTDTLSLSLQGGSLKSDSFSAYTPKEAEADAYENRNTKLQLNYHPNNSHKLTLAHYITDNESDYDLFAEDDRSTIESLQKQTQLNYYYTNHHGELRLQMGKSTFTRTALDSYDGTSRFESELEEAGIYAKMFHTKDTLNIGAEYKKLDGFNSYTSPLYNPLPAKANYTNKALYLAHTYRISNATLLETNLRYDDFNTFNAKLTYKAGLKHHLNSDLYTMLNYATAYDAPSSYQFANQAEGTSLTPTDTKGFEVGVGYTDKLTLTYFKNRSENEIIYLNNHYTNHHEDQIQKGFEVETQHTLKSINTHIQANYTKLLDFRETLIRRPKEQLNLTLDTTIQHNAHLSLQYQYIGKRVDLAYDPTTFESSSVKTGNYSLWHLHYGHSWSDNLTLNLHAKNLFDKTYTSVYGYSTAGRTWLATLSYTF
jgi:vitamin B12 transporter